MNHQKRGVGGLTGVRAHMDAVAVFKVGNLQNIGGYQEGLV